MPEEPPLDPASVARRLPLRVHACLLCRSSADRISVLSPYFLGGFERFQRCLYLADGTLSSLVSASLREAGVDLAAAAGRGAWRVEECRDLSGLVERSAVAAKEAGFAGLRVAVESGPLLAAGPGAWETTESRLREACRREDLSILCCHDYDRLRPSQLAFAVGSHDLVVWGSQVYCDERRLSKGRL